VLICSFISKMTGLFLLILTGLLGQVLGECPNACSAHGKCGAYDMCICYRNWVANDCSQRMCQFGLAYVDSPKGDLDAAGGALSNASTIVVVNSQFYPYGTTELYPAVEDTDGNILTNSAHEYRECSNAGICDRTTGTCGCFEGYEGSACQRASCPSNANGVCSGHGTCQTISEIAKSDFDNIYALWDKDVTLGCVCDAGYTGADCSERMCRVGVDPLYKDNNATIRYSNWTVQFYTQSSSVNIYGNYSLLFHDAKGMTWRTDPIAWNASCVEITAALERIPNEAIPEDSVRCYKFGEGDVGTGQIFGVDPIYESKIDVKAKYTIAFPKNPGRLPQIEINKYLDGNRPTLYTDETVVSTLGWNIYPNGFTGEYVDMVPDRCFDVTVTLQIGGSGTDTDTTTDYLSGLTTTEAKLLKTCLGDSNGISSDNIEVYNWDYGDYLNPHLIKLQDATQYNPALVTEVDGDILYDPQTYKTPLSYLCAPSAINAAAYGDGLCSDANPPGFYAVLYFDPSLTYPFRLYTPSAHNYGSTTEFYVYTTTGYLNLVNQDSVVFTRRNSWSTNAIVDNLYSNVLGVGITDNPTVPSGFYGDMSCENNPIGTNGARDCFNKGDWAMFLQTRNTSAGIQVNPIYPNMYQIAKIWKKPAISPNSTVFPNALEDIGRLQIILDYSMNAKFTYNNQTATGNHKYAFAYKFHPPTNNANGGTLYAAECSNRGICNTNTGLCECFAGFSDDDCSCLNALSV